MKNRANAGARFLLQASWPRTVTRQRYSFIRCVNASNTLAQAASNPVKDPDERIHVGPISPVLPD
jgi:hypothetical protein